MEYRDKLFDKVDRLPIESVPRTLMLIGEYGCGKKTLIDYMCEKYNLEMEDISDKLSLEYIEEITLRVHPKIYVIDCTKLTIKNENVILKFLEEPLKNSFIILTCEHKESVIPTVLNRCQQWRFQSYPDEYLREYANLLGCDSDLLLSVANTPGKILTYREYPISDMMGLANKMFSSMSSANFANALTIERFVAFKGEKDKFDFDLFTNILLLVSKHNCINNTPRCFESYELVRSLCNNKVVFNIDKKALFNKFLIDLKLLMSGG